MSKSFNIISALLKSSNGIGKNNRLPWDYIKEDMSFFKKITTSNKSTINAVIMGKNTWNSISEKSKPLQNRINIVLSKNKIHNKNNNVITANSLNEALNICYNHKKINDIFVIGGEKVYKEAIIHPDCKYLYLTKVSPVSYILCDTFFPKIPNWIVKKETNQIKKKGMTLDFEKWENIYDSTSNENQYINLVKSIIETGEKVKTRNGVVRKIFGPQHSFDLQKGFPLLTTKKMFFNGIVNELLFFIRGETNTNLLSQNDVNIWKKNTSLEFLKERGLNYPEGYMGPMYGFNWRHFGAEYKFCKEYYKDNGYDQLYHLIQTLTHNKHDRRHLLTTYDPSRISECVLAPCHGIVTQFYISRKNNNDYLNCKMYQRSVDVALGYPFNIASYALFVHLLCYVTGYLPGKLIMTLGDTHIYENHIKPLLTQIDRYPLKQPTLLIHPPGLFSNNYLPLNTTYDKITFLEKIEPHNITLNNYHCWPSVKMDMVA